MGLIRACRLKLNENTGESLMETLVALMIIVMGFTVLPGAIISGAKLDRAVDEQATVSELDERRKIGKVSVDIYKGETAAGNPINKNDVKYDLIEYGANGGLYSYGQNNK